MKKKGPAAKHPFNKILRPAEKKKRVHPMDRIFLPYPAPPSAPVPRAAVPEQKLSTTAPKTPRVLYQQANWRLLEVKTHNPSGLEELIANRARERAVATELALEVLGTDLMGKDSWEKVHLAELPPDFLEWLRRVLTSDIRLSTSW